MASITSADLRNRQTSGFFDVGLWFIIGAVIGISLLHYLTDAHLIPYHSIYRSLYYLPIAVGAIRYGRRGGIATAFAVSLLYLPHVILSWGAMPSDAFNDLLENVVFLFVGAFAGSLADAERKQRKRAQEAARQLGTANTALIEQVEVSERMRGLVSSILESIDSGVITIDMAGRIMMTNPSARRVIGDNTAWVADLPDFVGDYIAAGARGYQTQTVGERTYGLHGAPLIGARQEPAGTVLVLDDLTEQRALEEQVQRAQRLAALGRLAGGLAHEIRNPLSIARAAAQMLALRLDSNTEYAEYTHVIQTEIDRVDRLIEQLLTYSRPTVVHRAPIDVGELIERTVSLVQPYAAQQQVQLETDVAAILPPLHGDSELLHQALVNLLLNAVQATPQGKVVTVYALLEPVAKAVQIAVSDTGRGISSTDLPRIFDPFFTTRHDGTGLGLSIVQQIIQEHGGTVEVQSKVNHGTQFVLRLPLHTESGVLQ